MWHIIWQMSDQLIWKKVPINALTSHLTSDLAALAGGSPMLSEHSLSWSVRLDGTTHGLVLSDRLGSSLGESVFGFAETATDLAWWSPGSLDFASLCAELRWLCVCSSCVGSPDSVMTPSCSSDKPSRWTTWVQKIRLGPWFSQKWHKPTMAFILMRRTSNA